MEAERLVERGLGCRCVRRVSSAVLLLERQPCQHWELAREAFEEMKTAGSPLAQRKIRSSLCSGNVASGALPGTSTCRPRRLVGPPVRRSLWSRRLTMSPGAAQVALTLWLNAIAEQPASVPAKLTVVTGQGNHKAGDWTGVADRSMMPKRERCLEAKLAADVCFTEDRLHTPCPRGTTPCTDPLLAANTQPHETLFSPQRHVDGRQ